MRITEAPKKKLLLIAISIVLVFATAFPAGSVFALANPHSSLEPGFIGDWFYEPVDDYIDLSYFDGFDSEGNARFTWSWEIPDPSQIKMICAIGQKNDAFFTFERIDPDSPWYESENGLFRLSANSLTIVTSLLEPSTNYTFVFHGCDNWSQALLMKVGADGMISKFVLGGEGDGGDRDGGDTGIVLPPDPEEENPDDDGGKKPETAPLPTPFPTPLPIFGAGNPPLIAYASEPTPSPEAEEESAAPSTEAPVGEVYLYDLVVTKEKPTEDVSSTSTDEPIAIDETPEARTSVEMDSEVVSTAQEHEATSAQLPWSWIIGGLIAAGLFAAIVYASAWALRRNT